MPLGDFLQDLNPVTKLLIVIMFGVFFYVAIFSLLKPFFITQPTPVLGMMQQMAGRDLFLFSSTSSSVMNLVSLIIALAAMGIFSYALFQYSVSVHVPVHQAAPYTILRQALSKDEKTILDEIHKTGEITQDSLRFRLNWSKAKVSTILTNLDKRDLIQRERVGKTYKVFPSTQFKTV